LRPDLIAYITIPPRIVSASSERRRTIQRVSLIEGDKQTPLWANWPTAKKFLLAAFRILRATVAPNCLRELKSPAMIAPVTLQNAKADRACARFAKQQRRP
jgi:hypothetical protein